MNFKLGAGMSMMTRITDMRDDDMTLILTFDVNIRSCRQCDACLPITRQRKVAETPKLERRLSVARLTIPHQLQGQKVKGQGHLMDKCRDRKSAILCCEREGLRTSNFLYG